MDYDIVRRLRDYALSYDPEAPERRILFDGADEIERMRKNRDAYEWEDYEPMIEEQPMVDRETVEKVTRQQNEYIDQLTSGWGPLLKQQYENDDARGLFDKWKPGDPSYLDETIWKSLRKLKTNVHSRTIRDPELKELLLEILVHFEDPPAKQEKPTIEVHHIGCDHTPAGRNDTYTYCRKCGIKLKRDPIFGVYIDSNFKVSGQELPLELTKADALRAEISMLEERNTHWGKAYDNVLTWLAKSHQELDELYDENSSLEEERNQLAAAYDKAIREQAKAVSELVAERQKKEERPHPVAYTDEEGGTWHEPFSVKFNDRRVWDRVVGWRDVWGYKEKQ